MKKRNKNEKFLYDLEADVFMLEITNQPIDYATEIGNIVVHFSAGNIPVLIEVLEASKLFKQAMGIFSKDELVKILGVKPKPVLQSEKNAVILTS